MTSASRGRLVGSMLSALLVLGPVSFLVGGSAPAMAAPRCSRTAPSAHHAPGKAARVRGYLHTCPDGTLRLANGRKIRLIGLEYLQMGWGNVNSGKCDRTWKAPPTYAAADMRRWGFNSVALFVSWQNLEPTPPTFDVTKKRIVHHYDTAYLRTLDRTIARFRAARIAVLLVMLQSRWSGAFQDITGEEGSTFTSQCGMGMPTWLYETDGKPAGGGFQMVKAEKAFFRDTAVYGVKDPAGVTRGREKVQNEFIKAWKKVAWRYRSNKAVVGAITLFEAYDILAQPYPGTENLTPTALKLARFHERVGRALRRADPHLVVMYTDRYDTEKHQWSLTRRPRIPNAALASEFYGHPWKPGGLKRMVRYTRHARAWHAPFYIDEWDAFGFMRPDKPEAHDPTWAKDTKSLVLWCKQNQVSWGLSRYGGATRNPAFPKTGTKHRTSRKLLRILRHGF